MNRKQFYAWVQLFITQNNMDLQNAVRLIGSAPALMRLQDERPSIALPCNRYLRVRRVLNRLYGWPNFETVREIRSYGAADVAMIYPADCIEGCHALTTIAVEQDGEVVV
ncbi:hypothetical protein GGR95_003210 [Sulfitobacter undariae]|uniref:Uncharacterized protein n=1 Tax=Sulfitobacter undariae TaxID=1563671 RepID=A0A7W6H280_9RHOB|nr:hypothetical protein [Sulfitobacter undariae]MBB3995553.1 hypothetical protein [Sulfitobacter undariae]